ncbi:MAG TPA: FAD-dependent thymidylate synthase [Acidimicrobiales bacterium]|nr:FAD-dependent thymidylate synthase [Acidimicrobiales bacterium]
MTRYAVETFTPDEAVILRRYFTNLDLPVFALTNLPEVVKGALFARYSRSAKSLRRLFLDEFVGELDMTGDLTVDATMGLERAEDLYKKVFFEYGDDSVAQLGGVHLACEQSSNLLTKVLEWGRLMAYLEQSTRYIAYDTRLGNGRYRYYRDPEILKSTHGLRYVGDMDRMFDTYAGLVQRMNTHYAKVHPKQAGDSDFVWRQAVKAKAFDAVRGVLPAASLSNVGIYGTGQAYEQLLLRMNAHPLPEARDYAQMMLTELRKVIPSFLTRVDLPDRGLRWSRYLEDNRSAMAELADSLFGEDTTPDRDAVTLVDWDPEAENRMVAAMLYPYTALPDDVIVERVKRMSSEDKVGVVKAYVGERTNRRHRPGRALETVWYRFDLLTDYGAFRDLQRHRMLSIEWQALSTMHGYDVPEALTDAACGSEFDEAMERSAALHDELLDDFPAQAGYAVALAYKVRYAMTINARAAMQMLELRTERQGHPSYRKACQDMHTLIADKAGHHAVAEMMRYVDHENYDLERLESERRAESRRLSN